MHVHSSASYIWEIYVPFIKIMCVDFPGDIWSATAPCSGQWTWTFFTENFSPLQYWVFIIKSAMKSIWGWLFACALVQKAVLYAGLMIHANFSNFFNVVCRVWNFEFDNEFHSHETTKKFKIYIFVYYVNIYWHLLIGALTVRNRSTLY